MLRLSKLALVALLLVAACGDDDSGGDTTTTAGGSSATTTTAGGGGIVGDDSVSYTISGDYDTSGELPFVGAASTFNNEGWSATFATSDDVLVIFNTIPGQMAVIYGDTQVAVTGTELECNFNFTQNDANGLVGTFSCSGATGVGGGGTSTISVDISGEVNAHP